jgi:hypothetical protein
LGAAGSSIGLKVQPASDSSGAYVPVVALDTESISIGAVTANAGTNLNTSALALENGGNLAALAGTVSGGKLKVDSSGVTSPVSLASLPELPAGTNTIGTVLSPSVTPRAGTASTITTGGTAVTLFTGPINGGYIANPINAASQGISVAENAYVDPVGTPGSTDAAANGTTMLLEPGQTFSLPVFGVGVAFKANAATSGHKLTVVVW